MAGCNLRGRDDEYAVSGVEEGDVELVKRRMRIHHDVVEVRAVAEDDACHRFELETGGGEGRRRAWQDRQPRFVYYQRSLELRNPNARIRAHVGYAASRIDIEENPDRSKGKVGVYEKRFPLQERLEPHCKVDGECGFPHAALGRGDDDELSIADFVSAIS